MAQSVWNLAVNEGLKILDSASVQSKNTSIVFIGNEESGKTTLINNFLDREEEPRHCVALEYTYARRTNKQMTKDVCSIWELGGGSSYINLINSIIDSSNLSICIVTDLTKPQQLWPLFETVSNYLQTKAKTQVPVGIIGAKFEFVEELDSERRNAITNALQFWADYFKANVVFCTKRDRSSMKTAKDFVTSLAFGTKFSMSQLRAQGADSDSTVRFDDSSKNKVKQSLFQYYPPEDSSRKTVGSDPGKDPNYADEVIDNLWKQKEEELSTLNQPRKFNKKLR